MDYSRRVAERLMGRIQIRCVESTTWSFVATCPTCEQEKILTGAERNARRFVCCGVEWGLIPYEKSMGIELPKNLQKTMKDVGVPGYGRVKTWEEYRGTHAV